MTTAGISPDENEIKILLTDTGRQGRIGYSQNYSTAMESHFDQNHYTCTRKCEFLIGKLDLWVGLALAAYQCMWLLG